MIKRVLARLPFLISISMLIAITAGIACGAQEVKIPLPVPVAPSASSAPGAASRISIDVQVTDKLGNNVKGLTAADFSLLDNKDAAKILEVHEVDTRNVTPDPVHIVIVIDAINTGFAEVAWEREQLGQFLAQDGGRLAHPTRIAVLTEGGLKIEKNATLNGNALLALLNNTKSELRMVGRSGGFWGATDRLQWSLEQLKELAGYESTVPGRKFAFVLSPGWPMLTWAGMDATEKETQQIYRSVEAFSNVILASHMTIYAIDPYELGRTDPFYYKTYLKPVSKVNDATYPDLSLQVLAVHSGGLVEVNGTDILGDLNTVIRDTGLYYAVTYEAPAPDRVDECHVLRLTVDKPGATVRTSADYYAGIKPQ